MLLNPSTMGPFTLSQLVPARNGGSTMEEKDVAMKKSLASPQATSTKSKTDVVRGTRSAGSVAQRRPSRIGGSQFIHTQQKELLGGKVPSSSFSSCSSAIATNPRTRTTSQDGNVPHLGDLDSDEEVGVEAEASKPLEETVGNLLAQAVMKTPAKRKKSVTADLDSSSDEDEGFEEEKKQPKSLEQTTYDLIAQTAKGTAPATTQSSSTVTSISSAAAAADAAASRLGRTIRSSITKSMRRIKSMDESLSQSRPQIPTSFLKAAATAVAAEEQQQEQPNSSSNGRIHDPQKAPEVSKKHNNTTSKRLARGFARQRSHDDIPQHDDDVSIDGYDSSQDEILDSSASRRLAASRGGGERGKERSIFQEGEEDLGYADEESTLAEGSYVRKIAPRRYSSGGKLDTKLDRGSSSSLSSTTGKNGPASAPVGGATSRSLDSVAGDGHESHHNDNNSGNTINRRRRMLGRRSGRGSMMQRSSSVSSLLLKEKHQFTKSFHSSVRDDELGYEDHRHPFDTAPPRRRRGSVEEAAMPSADDLYGKRPQQQHSQQLSRGDHNVGRRKSGGYGLDPYEKNDSERDESLRRRDSLGYSDAQPDERPRQREERRSIGYDGVMTTEDPKDPCITHQQRRSIGHGGERQPTPQQRRSIGYGGVMSGGSELDGGSQRRRPSMGLREGDEPDREPSLRGQKTGMGDSQLSASNRRRSSTERGSNRGKPKERSSSIRGKSNERNLNSVYSNKRGSKIGLDGSRHGGQVNQRRRSQIERENSRRKLGTGNSKKKSLSPDREASARRKRNVLENQDNLEDGESIRGVPRNSGKLDAKMAKQTARKVQRSCVGSSESHGSGDSASKTLARGQVVPKKVRRANSDGMTASKLDRKLSKQNTHKQRKLNDSLRSGNSEQSGDSLGSSKSERSAKLGQMLNRDVRNKRRSFHDSLRSGTSSESAESARSTRSSPAGTGKGLVRKGGKKKGLDKANISNGYSSLSQKQDEKNIKSSMDTELKDGSENSATSHDSEGNDDLGGSIRSVQSCHTTLGRAHHRQDIALKVKEIGLVGNARSSLGGGDESTKSATGVSKLSHSVRGQGLAGFIPKSVGLGDGDLGNNLYGESRRNARNSLKTGEAILGRRSFSLTERRSGSSEKVVRSFSMRNSVAGLLHSDSTRNLGQVDNESEKDDIICYTSDENEDDDGPDSDSHSEEEEEEEENEMEDDGNDKCRRDGKTVKKKNKNGYADGFEPLKKIGMGKGTLRGPQAATVLQRNTSAEKQGNSGGAIRKIVSTVGAAFVDDENSVNSDGSGDIWDEFENGSLIDSDESASEKGDEMMSLSASGPIVNWDDEEDDDGADYLNPAMSPRISTLGKKSFTPKIAIEGMPPPIPLNNKSASKGKKSRSRRLSLLGGLKLEEEDTTESGSVLAPSLSEGDLLNAKRLKKRKSKKDLLKNGGDKFDWEEKAKEDKKRENKKKKKESEDELGISQHSKRDKKPRRANSNDGQLKARRGEMNRAASVAVLGKTALSDESCHKKDGKSSKKKRSQSVEVDESTRAKSDKEGKRSSLSSKDDARVSPKSEKKQRATTVSLLPRERGMSKSRRASRSKSPSQLTALDESKSGHTKSDRARSSRRRKSVDKDQELKRSKTSTDIGFLKGSSGGSGPTAKSKKGVRRTKSLCGPSDLVPLPEVQDQGGGSSSSKRASSVKRSTSKKIEEVPKGSKSKLKKKKSSSEHDSSERATEIQRLLEEEDPQVACSLLDKHSSVAEAKDSEGCLPLHFAAQRDLSAEVLEKLIEVYPKACECQCDRGFTPLHYAVEANAATPKIKTLIKACPRALKTQDRKGQVPLHIAVSHGARLSSVRLLVFIYPESVDIETAKGETARKIAKRKKANQEVLNELKSSKSSTGKS